MRSFRRRALPVLATLAIGAAATCPIGCASSGWPERVGSYRYAAAIEEHGEPDEREELADGGVRATWHHASAADLPVPGQDQPGGPVRVGAVRTVHRETRLVLTFGPDGLLRTFHTRSHAVVQ